MCVRCGPAGRSPGEKRPVKARSVLPPAGARQTKGLNEGSEAPLRGAERQEAAGARPLLPPRSRQRPAGGASAPRGAPARGAVWALLW